MNRQELRRYVGTTAHSLGHVEKDYLQHIVLAAYSRRVASALVFKGGTALQKAGVVPRFSEDLDFTLARDVSMARLEELASEALSRYNFPSEANNHREDERSLSFRLRVEGPLFTGPVSICTIRVEVSRREEVILSPVDREIVPQYPDVMPYILASMDLREMLAEKVRAISTRRRARDLYDLHWIARRGGRLDVDLVERKLGYYGMTYHAEEVLDRASHLSRIWDQELSALVERVPPFEDSYAALVGLLGEDEPPSDRGTG